MLEGLLVDLVPYGDRYLEQEHRWLNSEAWFWAAVGDRRLITESTLKRWREENAERQGSQPRTRVMWGVQTKDGKPLGDIAMNWVVPHCRLSMLGAAIGEPEYWGGGYGTDALLLITDYAFDWLDMHKLWLSTMGLNVRVQRQMAKVGYKLESRRRQAFRADGQWVDELSYGLLREEWPGRAAIIEKLGLKARPPKEE
ncbi:MAG: GNAT family N-acetyltransferase [Chloroflexi bacterium]|nr:GNAT family N-acetyltransferase [Chloroflexota bacterium]